MATQYQTTKFKYRCNNDFWAQPPNLIPTNISGYMVYYEYKQ